jgi:hypothetical protein
MNREIQRFPVRNSGHKQGGNAVAQKVRAVTTQIEDIQHELCTHLAAHDGSRTYHRASPSVSGEDVSRLRNAVDQLRRVLWFYAGNEEPATVLKEMGADITQDFKESPLQAQPTAPMSEPWNGSVSFFERLNLVIDGYMQPPGPGKKSPKI